MVHEPRTPGSMVVCLTIVGPAEELMWRMFAEQRDAEWRRLPTSEFQPPLVKLANHRTSPARNTLHDYSKLLLSDEPWGALHTIENWYEDLVASTFFNIWSVMSNLWRRMVAHCLRQNNNLHNILNTVGN